MHRLGRCLPLSGRNLLDISTNMSVGSYNPSDSVGKNYSRDNSNDANAVGGKLSRVLDGLEELL